MAVKRPAFRDSVILPLRPLFLWPKRLLCKEEASTLLLCSPRQRNLYFLISD